ncbi:hypothetical protein GCM10010517_64110 [Streptosporangium fragile]|uniref:Uncharacterized protein n=1 Tax=Streptosporangium fragile TaxID=46186 RepID=A0ABN3W7L1_9ACTN
MVAEQPARPRDQPPHARTRPVRTGEPLAGALLLGPLPSVPVLPVGAGGGQGGIPDVAVAEPRPAIPDMPVTSVFNGFLRRWRRPRNLRSQENDAAG